MRVTRPTLTKYVKDGTIKATIERKTVLYCRVSTQKQMKLYSKRKVLKIKEALTKRNLRKHSKEKG